MSIDGLLAPPMQPSSDIRRLIEIMAALRDPVAGCPWDVEQTFASIAPFTIEEAYEVADAVERGSTEDLREELGDLLLQVVFHARMAEEAGLFDFGGVVEAITDKLVRRHPHVFGDARALSPDAVKALWGRIKAEEKRAKSESHGSPGQAPSSALDGVPLALPALMRAMKLQEKAGKVGFDWNDVRAVLEKIREEVVEVEAEIGAGSAQSLSAEVGDLLFAAVNLARHLKVDPEAALRGANAKFERRFAHIEHRLAERGQTPEGASLDEMESLWVEAKAKEQPAMVKSQPASPSAVAQAKSKSGAIKSKPGATKSKPSATKSKLAATKTK
jgi:ATP diphosphatase